MPPIERVREVFSYNSLTGIIVRLMSNYKRHVGTVIFTRMVRIDGGRYAAASIAWAHYYGEWPDKIVDHKDRNPKNNKITNLRLATNNQNGYNMKYPSDFPKGVTFDANRTKRWRAQMRINGKKTNLGRFYTIEEATEAYRKAALEHHGEFVCLE